MSIDSFHIGTGADSVPEAQNADQHFLYNTTDGKLCYDEDGDGATEAVLVATLASRPTLTASDFHVYSA